MQSCTILYIAGLLNTLIYIVYALSNKSSICNEPVEEGKSTTIEFALKVDSDRSCNISVTNSLHGSIAQCFYVGYCLNTYPNLYNVSLNYLPNQCIIRVYVFNISRAGLLPDQELHFSYRFINTSEFDKHICSPKVFSVPRRIDCSLSNVKEGLVLTCSAQRIFPMGNCQFSANFSLMIGSVNRIHSTQPAQQYFSVNCSIFINLTHLSQGLHAIKAVIYTNVTGNVNDIIAYGVSTFKYFYLEKPVVSLEGCPQSIQEGLNWTCHCKKADRSVVNESISWYDPDNDEIVVDGNLVFTANRNRPAYFCKSQNNIGWKSKRVFYRPVITVKSDESTNNSSTIIVLVITSLVAVILSVISISIWCIKSGCSFHDFEIWNDFNSYQPAKGTIHKDKKIELQNEDMYSPVYQATSATVNNKDKKKERNTEKNELHYGYAPCISILNTTNGRNKPVHYSRQTHQFETL